MPKCLNTRCLYLESGDRRTVPRLSGNLVDALDDGLTRSGDLLRFVSHKCAPCSRATSPKHCVARAGANSSRGEIGGRCQDQSLNVEGDQALLQRRMGRWGPGKAAELLGTEAVLNALILANFYAQSGKLSDDNHVDLEYLERAFAAAGVAQGRRNADEREERWHGNWVDHLCFARGRCSQRRPPTSTRTFVANEQPGSRWFLARALRQQEARPILRYRAFHERCCDLLLQYCP